MKLIAGLGNPGKQYLKTRHNVGFSAVRSICYHNNISSFQAKFNGELAITKLKQYDIIFFMPMAYMNNSGVPIEKVAKFYKICAENILVIHDDLDVCVGKMKIKKGGGDAGHNGVKSIDNLIGKDYQRLRIGIGKPNTPNTVSDYVLGEFSSVDFKKINTIFEFLGTNLGILLDDQKEKFLNLYNIYYNCRMLS